MGMVDRDVLPTHDRVRPSESGCTSGRGAADQARASAAAARRAQTAAQKLSDETKAKLDGPHTEARPTVKPVDAEAQRAFVALDFDMSGGIDLRELAQGIRSIEGDMGVMDLYRAVDLDSSGELDLAEWIAHFNAKARTQGRAAVVSMLANIQRAAELMAGSRSGREKL